LGQLLGFSFGLLFGGFFRSQLLGFRLSARRFFGLGLFFGRFFCGQLFRGFFFRLLLLGFRLPTRRFFSLGLLFSRFLSFRQAYCFFLFCGLFSLLQALSFLTRFFLLSCGFYNSGFLRGLGRGLGCGLLSWNGPIFLYAGAAGQE
jgi:hypothetical protein